MRAFIVFHDCTHGSFLPSRRANLWLGRLSGLLVFQPFANWRHNHAVHHGTSGDLDRRGTGDVPTLTFDEYVASPWRKRLGYRLFRNPLVMFGIGPLWSLMIGPRLWSGSMRPRQVRSVIVTNFVLAVAAQSAAPSAYTPARRPRKRKMTLFEPELSLIGLRQAKGPQLRPLREVERAVA